LPDLGKFVECPWAQRVEKWEISDAKNGGLKRFPALTFGVSWEKRRLFNGLV
jgi:hypothetical protein